MTGNPPHAAVYTLVMKQLLVIAFAALSLSRPSVVLCVQHDGDVQVGHQATISRTPGDDASSFAVASLPAEASDNCLDVSLSTHSLASKRAHELAQPVAVFDVVFATDTRASAGEIARVNAPVGPAPRFLSTTVLRR